MKYLEKFTKGENPLIKEISEKIVFHIIHIRIVFDEHQMPKTEKEMEAFLLLTEEISNRNKIFWSSDERKLKYYESPYEIFD